MEQHLRARPELLPAILTTLFEMVLFEDVGNQWSLSRPMLALILVNEDIYLHLQRQIIDAQPADKCGPHLPCGSPAAGPAPRRKLWWTVFAPAAVCAFTAVLLCRASD